MKITICPICAAESSLWLVLSAGIAWGYLATTYVIPIALLMGGTVVGIAYLGEKCCHWAANHPQRWKSFVVLVGMPIAYLAVTHITKLTIIFEFFTLVIIAYFFFIKRSSTKTNGELKESNTRQIEEKMEQCC